MNQYGFFIDLSRCIGCNACTVSCKQWHDISPGPAKPVRVYQWETGQFPDIQLHMLPVMCFHCETPLCLDACESKAIYKEEKYGAVLVDREKCQGSRRCWEACPYGAPQFEGDQPDAKMTKCTMCIDRLEKGLKPICVLSCSMRALEFGPLNEIIQSYGNQNRVGAKAGYAPCRLNCPAEVDAEGYMAFLSERKFKEAIDRFRETTPFAGTLGRLCTHPCEGDCQRGKIDQSVSIRALKRFMADYELREGRERARPVARIHEDPVAIIGSGPAGLSCAYDLVKMGYPVTIFETAPKSGGMLRYCIPEYRLPKGILDNEIRYIEELGVEIKPGTKLANVDEVFAKGYKAIFIATGTWISHRLGIPGEDADGVMDALDLLKRVNSGEKVKISRKVVVIGGGSVAIDASRIALRLGAKEVHLVCLETREFTSRDRMPAQDREIEEAEQEGVLIHPCLGVKEIRTDQGRVSGIETVGCVSVFDHEEKFSPKFSDEGGFIEAETIILAVGQKADPTDFVELDRGSSGNILADELTLETNIKGVFAGADVVTGPANVIRSIAHGKRGAVSIDRFLRGVDLREGRNPLVEEVNEQIRRRSLPSPTLPIGERKDLCEVEKSYDQETAMEQASRCLRCGSIMPSVVFKPIDPKVMLIPWDGKRTLELWQKRDHDGGERLPDLFDRISDVTEASLDNVGRNKLVLKAKNCEELLYYTMDDE